MQYTQEFLRFIIGNAGFSILFHIGKPRVEPWRTADDLWALFLFGRVPPHECEHQHCNYDNEYYDRDDHRSHNLNNLLFDFSLWSLGPIKARFSGVGRTSSFARALLDIDGMPACHDPLRIGRTE